jgi:hypothetical protein
MLKKSEDFIFLKDKYKLAQYTNNRDHVARFYTRTSKSNCYYEIQREGFLLGARGPSAISTFSLRTETSALVGFTLFIFSLPLDKVRLTK